MDEGVKRILSALRWIPAGILLAVGLMLFPRLPGGLLILSAYCFLPGRRPLMRLIPAVLLLAAGILLMPSPGAQLAEPIAAVELPEETAPIHASAPDYVLNTSSGKFHYPDCGSVSDMAEHNRQNFYGTREEAIEAGYEPCGRCKP